MWVDKTRVYAAKAIDNEYAYGRLNAGHKAIPPILRNSLKLLSMKNDSLVNNLKHSDTPPHGDESHTSENK